MLKQGRVRSAYLFRNEINGNFFVLLSDQFKSENVHMHLP